MKRSLESLVRILTTRSKLGSNPIQIPTVRSSLKSRGWDFDVDGTCNVAQGSKRVKRTAPASDANSVRRSYMLLLCSLARRR